MRRIKYPYNDDFEKEIFITSYYNLIKKNIDVVQLEKTLSCIDSEYNLKKLLTCDFVDLLAMSKKIKESSHEKKLKDFFIKNNKPIKYLYDDYQLKISSFLMDNSINLNTCHYCNIDFINTIEQRYQFNSIKDFILNAPYEVLMLVKEIKKDTAKRIIKHRKYQLNRLFNWTNLINESIYNSLFKIFNSKKIHGVKNVDFRNITIKKNHFTLDHVLPKNEFTFLSLSIFNLVPSCYSCNSKFKHQKEFTINSELEKLCPTSDKFIVDELLIFKMKFDINDLEFDVKIKEIEEIKDVEIELQNTSSLIGVDEFIDIFKLKSRYDFHKKISFEMIEKRKLYSDSQIDEISLFFANRGIIKNVDSIKKDIFGNELFEENNAPFEKYKKDIAKQLGLIK